MLIVKVEVKDADAEKRRIMKLQNYVVYLKAFNDIDGCVASFLVLLFVDPLCLATASRIALSNNGLSDPSILEEADLNAAASALAMSNKQSAAGITEVLFFRQRKQELINFP